LDYIKRFLYKDEISVILSRIEDIVKSTQKAHEISFEDALTIGKAASLAACFVLWEKDENASVAVSLKYPETGKNYMAIAEKDGRVRGCVTNFNSEVIKNGVILEITQKLPIKGDYTGVVTAENEEAAVYNYFRNSRQTIAKCIIKEINGACFCIIIEQIPGHFMQEQSSTIEDAEKLLKNFTDTFDDSYIKETKYFEKLENIDLTYGCTCSGLSVSKMLAAIPPEELEDCMVDGKIEVSCKFCGKKYKIEY
jgi:redox-regulated HSP33 family molecular chaperone